MLQRVYGGSFASMAVLGLLAACGGGGSATGSNNNGGGGNNNSANATIQALPTLAFAPSNITIQPGQTVAWVFGSVGHTVTFTPGQNGSPADIGDASSPNVNTTVIRSFLTAGTYYYHCSIHPTMGGVIFVGATGTDTSTYTKDTTTYTGYGVRSGN